MKKTRKILSIVLAVLFAFSSMPVVYTGTAAADVVGYALGETGTLENPTRPIEASGSINRTDLYKLNINSQSTSYTFYQTKDDEYFTFGQTQGLQNYYQTSVGSRTLTFESISFYEGASGMDGSTEPKEISSGFGMWETPLITNNPTSEFLDKYYVSSQWKATNGNADGVGSKPENFVLQGAWTDIGGCKIYTWQNDVVFKGNPAGVSGEINTGYYEQLFWNWTSSDASARFDLRLGTTLHIIDARELVNEIAKAEEVINNPAEYTKEYVSSVEATLNTIPDNMRDLSEVYSQSEFDKYAQALKDVSLNSADYTEYNQLYKSLKALDNSKGAYTGESFSVFKEEIELVNQNLPKNLDKTQQSVVDAASQALRDAYAKLVTTDISETEDSYYFAGTDNSGNINITVKNVNLKFMQIRDDQEFTFTQNWTLQRTGGSNKRIIYRVTLDESMPLYCGDTSCQSNPNLTENKTSDFISRMDTGYTTRTGYDADGTSFTAKEFTTWASDAKDGDQKLVNDGIIGGEFGLSEATYNATVSPRFRGNSSSENGEISTNFVQRIGYKYYTGVFQYKYRHFHINTTVTVTDVRQLISAIYEANEVIENPGTHSDAYISALRAAIDSVPTALLQGVEYYTQAEVDKYYNAIKEIPEDVADYSAFVETFEWMLSEDKEKFTVESYNRFIEEIYEISGNLPKNLSSDQQAVVDEAVQALYDAHDKLVFLHLNDDNVFTQDDLTEVGNSPLEFSVSSTQYNFMQVADGQQFAIRTYLTARNSKDRYTCSLLSLRFSIISADTVDALCAGRSDPDEGCHNGEAVAINQTEFVVGAVSGLNKYGSVNDAGDIAEHNTWVNTGGVALSSNGILNDPTTLSSSESSAYAEMYYTGPTGNQEENSAYVDATFAYRLGWSYYETVLGINGETTRRHAHIPVNIKITDARALNDLYEKTDAILNGSTDNNYTFETLVNLYNAFNKVDPDMAYGTEYFTQEEVNVAYEELKAAYNELDDGADYSEYFEAYVKAEEIMNTNNADSKGNTIYEHDAFDSFVEDVTNIENNLDKNLPAGEENQKKIDEATQAILDAVAKLEESKLADYSRLNDAMLEAEKIFAEEQENPGTYTQETLDAIQNAYNDALQNAFNNDPEIPHNELHADQQATVDAAADALEAAIESKEYKADYSEYNDAYNKVQDIIDNPGKYTEETVQAAKDVMNTAGAIDKDLADTAENRQTIADATDALNNVVNNAVEKADYSKFDEAYKAVEEIANDTTGKYTDATIQAAKDALVEADVLEKNLSKTEENQARVDEATGKLENMLAGAKEKANYDGLDEAIKDAQDIVNAPDGTYTEETVKNAQDALDAAEALDKDLPKSEQETVDKVIQDLIDSATNAKEKADYSGLDEALEDAKEIVNNPDKYTEETVKNAQDALDAAEALDKDLPKSEQETVDKVIQDLIDSVTNAKEKADYSGLDEALEDAKEIVNNPDKYTEETVKNAQDAIDAAENLNKDLEKNDENQAIIDGVIQDLIDSVTNAEEKADYTDYNNAKADADNLVNDDGNGNPIYDEEAFQQYKDAVEKLDSELNKDLPKEDQEIVDKATEELKDLRTELDASKGSEQEIIDPETKADSIKDKVIEEGGYNPDEVIVEFKNYLGEELAGEAFVGTGSTMRVILKSTGELLEYKLFIVMGDVDGDGDVDNDDYQKSMRIGLKKEAYTEEQNYFFIANDMSGDGYIDVIDCALIRRMF